MTYNEDFTANLEANIVREEFATINYDALRDYYYIVPKKAPFHTKDFKIRRITSSGRQDYKEHVDFSFGAKYLSLGLAAGKPIYGAVVIPRLDTDAEFVLEYRTVGDPHIKQEAELLSAVSNIVINPVGLSWEYITGTPTWGRPIGHVIDYSDTQGQSELIQVMRDISTILTNRASQSGNFVDVRDLNKILFGLDNVPNFSVANITTLAKTNNTQLMTPLLTYAMLEELGLVDIAATIKKFNEHLIDEKNPHKSTAGDFGLDKVPNLPLAEDDDIIRGISGEKLFSTRQMLMWLRLHGPSLGIGHVKHKPGTKLSSYCRSGSPHRWAIISTGEGTREEIEKENDVTCGALTDIKIAWPAKGEVYKRYCDNGNLMKLVSNGDGTAYSDVDELDSRKCVTNTILPAGTEISFNCSGTTLTQYMADGQGQVITVVTENSERCNAVFPPEGQFIRESCEGQTQIIYEADGRGNERIRSRNENSAACGYVPPTQPQHPIAGTVIGFRCVDGVYYDLIADGVGGNFPQVNTAKASQCAQTLPPTTTTSTTTTRQVVRNPALTWTTTHTSIYINDTETQKITGTGFTPNELITLKIMGEGQDWGAPFIRNLGERQVRADSTGAFTLRITVTETGIVPKGVYRSWFETGNVISNSIHRTFYGNRF